MPKKFKELKNKKLDDSLSGQEKNQVRKVEDYIDEQIDLQWENGSVLVAKDIADFVTDPNTGNPTTYSPEKRKIMNELLFSIYRDNDWRTNVAITGEWRFTPTKK